MKPVLEVENLTFAYDSAHPVLDGITCAVREGECVGIVGANGAGKSTLLWCLLGLLKAAGAVRFFGEELHKRNLARIGVVFQNPEDQLFMPRLIDDITLPLVNRGMSAAFAAQKAGAALESVGLPDMLHRPASQLSLGERKRAAIASALAGSPDLLLLDEPTAELDGRAVRQLAGVLQGLTMARVIAGHDLGFFPGLAERILVLAKGKVVAEGPARQILADRALLEEAGLV
jgi:energy-coupling factor transporter ATP-binding protein EcfA2